MIFLYDGSFEGCLCCIFETFKSKQTPTDITDNRRYQLTLLDQSRFVTADEELAMRVLKGIDARTDNRAAAMVYKMFLSELPGIELSMLYFIQAIISKNDVSILSNFANQHILKAAQIEKMISREIHRMHAFIRFQKTREDIFYALIAPDFNVLPLIAEHFEKRYADQPWIIFDTQRGYGVHYDLTESTFVSLNDPSFNLNTKVLNEKESLYQLLWESYFQSVNILERKNTKLHLRHLPKRYWKYLVEKKSLLRKKPFK